ncbi:hypothetical protein Tco_0241407 [Tanacetum coccineum]
MEGLPRCDELLMSANSHKWEESMIIYCRRSIIEDSRIARETNRAREKEPFIQKLRNSKQGYGENVAAAYLKERQNLGPVRRSLLFRSSRA